MRVAIIGAGPRGLFAVERLWAHHRAGVLDVVLFDPREPGHGAAYDPGQPSYLRLNVTSAVVSAGWPGEDKPPAFNEWRLDHGEVAPLDPFPPRARVGEYLRWFWAWLQDNAPDGATVAHRQERVTTLQREPRGWLVDGDRFDEVLLATGHESNWPGALGGPGVVPALPVAAWADSVPAGGSVAVRGAALTFIDAALAMTEGRGGRFEGDWRTGLTYVASGSEPAVIWPTSRTGLLMDPKPQPGTPLAVPDEDVMGEGRRAVSRARSRVAALRAVGDTASILVGAAIETTPVQPATGAVEAMRERLQVMAGAREPGAAWALGHAWRGLYDALRARFEGIDGGFAPFAQTAVQLERVAFGPPPINAAKILALLDAGIIDPSSLDGGPPREPDLVVVNIGTNPEPDYRASLEVLVDNALAAAPTALTLASLVAGGSALAVAARRRGL